VSWGQSSGGLSRSSLLGVIASLILSCVPADESLAFPEVAVRPAVAEAQRASSRAWMAWVAGCAIAAVALFFCYLWLSRTQATQSDGASNALEAWDMMHGNPLLRGWTLTDVSFYTTELPEYIIIELIRGLSADVIHVAAACSFAVNRPNGT